MYSKYFQTNPKKRVKQKGELPMTKMMNLQDTFLNQARKERILVTTYLVNGFQCKGIVKGFDNYVVIFDCQGQQQLVYKHAISTIAPSRPVSILDQEQQEKPAEKSAD